MSDGRWQLLLHLQGSTSVGFSYISFVLLGVPFAILFKCILCPYASNSFPHFQVFFPVKAAKQNKHVFIRESKIRALALEG